MTLNLVSPEGLRKSLDLAKDHIEKVEENSPVLASVEEGAVTATLGTIGILGLKSGITRLASCESTYGGVGPIITAIAGVASIAAAVITGRRTVKTIKRCHEKFGKKDDAKTVNNSTPDASAE